MLEQHPENMSQLVKLLLSFAACHNYRWLGDSTSSPESTRVHLSPPAALAEPRLGSQLTECKLLVVLIEWVCFVSGMKDGVSDESGEVERDGHSGSQ